MGGKFGALAVVCVVASAHADPLDKPSFTATPEELLAAAKAGPIVDADAVVLRDETTFTFDEAGRHERRMRIVIALQKQSAVDGWGTLELDYEPFYQDKPVVRARVVEAGGHVAELDPKLITDTPAVSDSPQVFSDRRTVQVPLPRLSIGSVVEEEVVIKDREPLLHAGIVTSSRVGRNVPVRRALVTVVAPSNNKTRVIARGFAKPPTPRKTTAGNRTTWLYDFAALEPSTRYEAAVPSDITPWPTIGVSTGASWSAIAADYGRILDERLAPAGDLAMDVKGASQRETLDRLVAWLHEHVRYTGIEFSDAAIVPWAPAETVKRGFGDCKDKASLLVALLRARGIRADVALLSSGPGSDVDRQLPGMGDFDHAIVRASIAGKDVWIDATESGLPAGQLPARDQGRLALIAAADTKDLVMTPMSSPADNVLREVRTFHLGETGRATVTEVSTETGTLSDELRGWVRTLRHDDLEKHLTSYADEEYKGKLVGFSSSDPASMTAPFSLTVEIGGSAHAFTDRKQIDVYLFPANTLKRVPHVLSAETTEQRRNPFEWFEPHVYEIENRLVVPSGYTMPQLVAHEQQALGTMTLVTDRRVDHDTLVITYRLDTGKRQLSTSEVTTTRAAVIELDKRTGEHVVIAQTAWLLVQQGKLREAIDECKRLIAAHPKEALHWGQLADVYREAGMGAAARRAARQGVAVDPRSSDAHDLLAYQLRHDTLGREFTFDWDRKGAIAEYRKALELDPKHLGALKDFATLLNRDDLGQLTSDARDAREAAALWRRANGVDNGHEYDQQVVTDLLISGQLAEAESSARAMPVSRTRSLLLIAAVSAVRGANEGIALASTLETESGRKKVLADAAGILVFIRRYDAARALFAESKDLDTNANRAALMASLAVVDPSKLAPADPLSPARLALMVMMGAQPPASPPWSAELGKDLVYAMPPLGHSDEAKQFRLLPRPVVNDMLAALAQPSVDGDAAHGWRVTLDVGPAKSHYYVVLEHGKALLVGVSDVEAGLGPVIQALVGKGDLAAAAQWMKWSIDDLDAKATNPLALYATIWNDQQAKQVSQFPSKDLLELGAAVMMARTEPKIAAPILRHCGLSGDDVAQKCRRFLELALTDLAQWTEVAEVARQITEHEPADTFVVGLRAHALAELGHTKEAAELLDAVLAKQADDLPALRARADVALLANDWTSARVWLQKRAEHPHATIEDVNGAAWLHLYYDATPDDARKIGSRGERMQSSLTANFANTLAAIEAESDHPYEAWKYLQKAFDARRDGKPHDADWYVLGRIAETYGLRDDAIAAYRRITKPAHVDVDNPTSYDFARRGLARLGVH